LRKDILVFVEGARTEEDYLLHWHRANRLRVNMQIYPEHGTPRTLVDLAVSEKRRAERQSRSGRPFDEVWCVFDVDEHPRLQEAETKARANGVHLAVSNPCIELWFLLHFRDQTGWIDRGEAQRAAIECLACGKSMSDGALRALEERHADARARAQALDAKHLGDGSPPGSNPSSATWTIVDSIMAP
jgi:hypothetical protein